MIIWQKRIMQTNKWTYMEINTKSKENGNQSRKR